jgi:response regulator of citrate/malate metabolism
MEITKDWLRQEIDKFTKQRQHAHEVAIASQAAVDVLTAISNRLDLPEPSGDESSEEAN